MLCYLALGLIRYGWRSKVVWGISAFGAIAYIFIVFPYSQYVRHHGGRDGSLFERLEVIKEVFFNVSTDADFRNVADSDESYGEFYLGKPSLHTVTRFAMVGEADRLVAATDNTQSYTGWQTIIDGVKLMVPSFIMPDKPTFGSGNLLGHIAGELAPDDMTTQVSYGFMANLYNAFGLPGVLSGSILLIFVLYYVLRLYFQDQELSFGPLGSSIWYVLIGVLFEHALVEFPIGSIFPAVTAMLAPLSLVLLARVLTSFLQKRRA